MDELPIEGTPRTQDDWEKAVQEFLNEGQNFKANDWAKVGVKRYPDNKRLRHLWALALLRTGAPEQARKVLEPYSPNFDLGVTHVHDAYTHIRDAEKILADIPAGETPPQKALDAIERVAAGLRRVDESAIWLAELDKESLGRFAKVDKVSWAQTGEWKPLKDARDLYEQGYRSKKSTWLGVNAATLSLIMREFDHARSLAHEVLDQCEAARSDPKENLYWNAATLGEALLLLGRKDEAVTAYGEAATIAKEKAKGNAKSMTGVLLSPLEQLLMMADNGINVPKEIFDALAMPAIVFFVGHMIDAPDRPRPRFPPEIEVAVRAAIDKELDTLGPSVGYCSAACGSDILFIEAMIDRGNEVNIVLPFATKDFLQTSVSLAGTQWERRFAAALKLADQVTYATEEPYLEDKPLFQFANVIVGGMAAHRARARGSNPSLLAVWDGVPSLLAVWDGVSTGFVGGTSECVEHWPDENTLTVIPIDEIAEKSGVRYEKKKRGPARAGKISSEAYFKSRGREIKHLLFADIKGYSKLKERHMEIFLDFMKNLSARLAHPDVERPSSVNTWGGTPFLPSSTTPPPRRNTPWRSARRFASWEAGKLPAFRPTSVCALLSMWDRCSRPGTQSRARPISTVPRSTARPAWNRSPCPVKFTPANNSSPCWKAR